MVARRVAKRRDTIAPYKRSSSSGVSVAGSSVTLAEDATNGIDTPRPSGPPLLLEGTPAGEAPAAVTPAKLATIDDLRALDEETRGHIADFVISGAPIPTLRRMLEAEQGLRFTEDAPVVEFYQEEARRRWQNTFDTASADADAMINVLRHSDLDFSEVLLKALGQQAFRMITQRELNTKQVEKFTRLLLQARGQDVSRTRAKEALALQREKMERQFQSDLEKALNALADEIKAHPEVRESFVFFRAKLKEAMRAKAKIKKMPAQTPPLLEETPGA
ncbi:MAG: hypothetical protein B9S32_17350 [Verrucomicrobia bacterium Tous-C9LFEB]|nr:MAG: hypothetical protein B9S32_17350 [Verrucomicrobia bacterium Tous-C9LFEB]